MEESSKIIEQPQQNENIIPNSRYQNLYEEENSIEPHHMVSQSWNFTPKQNFYLNVFLFQMNKQVIYFFYNLLLMYNIFQDENF